VITGVGVAKGVERLLLEEIAGECGKEDREKDCDNDI